MNRKVKKAVAVQRYKLHQETKQERLEELRNKLEQYDITGAFKYSSICNSVFGKRRILSRKRINQIILGNRNEK